MKKGAPLQVVVLMERRLAEEVEVVAAVVASGGAKADTRTGEVAAVATSRSESVLFIVYSAA
jgi:hypothetical protein